MCRSFCLAFGLVAISLAINGCTANEVARNGMAYRGPAAIGVQLDEQGNLLGLNAQTGGGTGSVVHVSRKTWYENGTPKSDFTASSDPTLVQMEYFTGVRNQSQQDTTNFTVGLQAVSTQIMSLSTGLSQLATDYRNQNREGEQDRQDRIARETKRDERIDKLTDALNKWLFKDQAPTAPGSIPGSR